MTNYKKPLTIFVLLIIITILVSKVYSQLRVVVAPYINSTPPSGQYHHISEIWIDAQRVDWGGIEFINLTRICLDPDCIFSIYRNETHLIIIAPNIYIPNISLPPPSLPWLPGFSYRIPITITERSGQNLVDYQVNITFDSASLIAQGKMRSDCGDIRFTDSDGVTLLPYWIESCPAAGWTNISVQAFYGTGTTCVSDMNNFPSTPNSYGTNDWWTFDPWSCDNCDMYVRIYLNIIGSINSVLLEVNSDDGHVVWVNGQTVGSAGGRCHEIGLAAKTWDITPRIVQGQNEIRIWCSEWMYSEFCNFRLIINGQEIRRNGNYNQGPHLAKAWIKVNLTANQNKTIYMYYGNPNAQNIGNLSYILDLFSSFENGWEGWIPSKYEKITNYSNNTPIITSDFSINGYYSARLFIGGDYQDLGAWSKIERTLNVSYPFVLLFDYIVFGEPTGYNGNDCADFEVYIDGAKVYSYRFCKTDLTRFYNVKITGNSINNKIEFVLREASSGGGWTDSRIVWIDNIRIYKYAPLEPIVSFGNEEIKK